MIRGKLPFPTSSSLVPSDPDPCAVPDGIPCKPGFIAEAGFIAIGLSKLSEI
jgi:hypothetical protein